MYFYTAALLATTVLSVVCPTTSEPACATNNITYLNQCTLHSFGATRARDGICDPAFSICSAKWKPVCGINNHTYECENVLGAAGVRKAYNGVCKSKKPKGLK